jgi:hypothetical protein
MSILVPCVVLVVFAGWMDGGRSGGQYLNSSSSTKRSVNNG